MKYLFCASLSSLLPHPIIMLRLQHLTIIISHTCLTPPFSAHTYHIPYSCYTSSTHSYHIPFSCYASNRPFLSNPILVLHPPAHSYHIPYSYYAHPPLKHSILVLHPPHPRIPHPILMLRLQPPTPIISHTFLTPPLLCPRLPYLILVLHPLHPLLPHPILM